MTANQTAQFERAFARAVAECIEVIDQGVDADGRPFYTVSGSKPGTQYLVIQVNAAQFACTCPAGQNGVICTHRAACRARLMAQASAAALAVATADAQRAADDDAREMELYPGYHADLDAAAARIQSNEVARAASGLDYDEFDELTHWEAMHGKAAADKERARLARLENAQVTFYADAEGVTHEAIGFDPDDARKDFSYLCSLND